MRRQVHVEWRNVYRRPESRAQINEDTALACMKYMVGAVRDEVRSRGEGV